MITEEGLSDQLLSLAVAEELPALEATRQNLVTESADNKRRLAEIENSILHTLSSSQVCVGYSLQCWCCARRHACAARLVSVC